MGTIVLSWLFMHTIFAQHYAHEYYGEHRNSRVGGLEIPGQQEPDYWDFLYFSFVIAMTSQVSDVQITSKSIRHMVECPRRAVILLQSRDPRTDREHDLQPDQTGLTPP